MKEELFYVKAKEMIKNGNSENWILGYYTKKQVNDKSCDNNGKNIEKSHLPG